jgi:hypothetical protein
MKATASTEPQTRKLTDYPAYLEVTEKLEDRKKQRNGFAIEVDLLKQQLARDPQGLDGAADRLLRGELEHEPDWASTRDALNAQLREKEKRLAITDLAIAKQENIIRDERGGLAREIGFSVKPAHDTANRQSFLALIEVLRGQLTVLQIRERLTADGVPLLQDVLPSFYFDGLGLGPAAAILDRNSQVSYLLRDAVKQGCITSNEIPSEWRICWSK